MSQATGPAGARPRPGRLFVSSVFGGMMDLRRRVEEAVAGLGFEALMAEDLVAQSRDVASVLELEIARCDTYIGVFSRRQGTVPEGEHWAITEQEYRLARDRGLRCLAFYNAEAEPEPGLKAFLETQVFNYRAGVYPRPFRSEDELRLGIVSALSALRPQLALWLGPDGGAGSAGRLFLAGMRPAMAGGSDEIGPFPVNLDLPGDSAAIFARFLSSRDRETLLPEQLGYLGRQLAAHTLPGEAGTALARALDLCGEAGLPLLLTIRTRDPAALALPWEMISVGEHMLPVRDGRLVVARRILAESDDTDPASDPGATLPRRQFGVLGFTSEPLEDQGMGFGLGAEGLSESRLLFWDREQDILLQALDPVLVAGGGRLVLPDTGAASELRAELDAPDRPGILHLSGHGGPIDRDGATTHAIFLEDDEGHRLPATAGDLRAWVGDPKELDLVFLSACYTAATRLDSSGAGTAGARVLAHDVQPDLRTGSLAEALIRGGLPRVLGMQSTISDEGAILFAHAFYRALARGGDAVGALVEGRSALREAPGAHEWAIPVMLTRRDLGPLVALAEDQERSTAPLKALRSQFDIGAEHGRSVSYLAEGYVGRRQYERRLHAAWKARHALIVIHGLGGIGKSTIAARFLERRAGDGDRVLVLPPGERIAANLLDEVAERLGVERRAELPPDAAESAFRADLSTALRSQPTLLLLDNLEDNQVKHAAEGGEVGGAGRSAAVGELKDLRLGEALVDLARLAQPSLQLPITSRLPLRLPDGAVDPTNLDLGALSPAEARKLKLTRPGLQALAERDWQRVLFYLGGHPKALELLGGYLHRNTRRLQPLMQNLEATLGRVDASLAAEAQLRGRRLLIDEVIHAVPPAHLPALDRLSLLVAPLPSAELVAILEADGIADGWGQLEALRDRGLLAETVSPNAIEGGDAVHRLIASRRLGALAEREGVEAALAFHRRAAEHFEKRDGPLSDFATSAHHLKEAGDPAAALAIYNRWALTLRERHTYMACAQVALRGIDGIAHVGSLLGQLLAAFEHPDALPVLRQAQEAWRVLGQQETAEQIEAIIRQVEAGSAAGE